MHLAGCKEISSAASGKQETACITRLVKIIQGGAGVAEKQA